MARPFVLYLALGLFVGPATARADKSIGIVPGVRIGVVKLGDSQKQVLAKLGRPGRSFRTHGGRSGDRWENGMFEVVYKNRRVVQIQTYLDRYKTGTGVSTATPMATIHRLYPRLRAKRYSLDTADPTDNETGDQLVYFANERGGITFVAPSPWKKEGAERPSVVIVHPRGRRAIPTLVKEP